MFFFGIASPADPDVIDADPADTLYLVRSERHALANAVTNRERELVTCIDHADATVQHADMPPRSLENGFVVSDKYRDGRIMAAMVDQAGNLWTLGQLDWNTPDMAKVVLGINERREHWGLSLGVDIVWEDARRERVREKRVTHVGVTQRPEFEPEGSMIHVTSMSIVDMLGIIIPYYAERRRIYLSPALRERIAENQRIRASMQRGPVVTSVAASRAQSDSMSYLLPVDALASSTSASVSPMSAVEQPAPVAPAEPAVPDVPMTDAAPEKPPTLDELVAIAYKVARDDVTSDKASGKAPYTGERAQQLWDLRQAIMETLRREGKSTEIGKMPRPAERALLLLNNHEDEFKQTLNGWVDALDGVPEASREHFKQIVGSIDEKTLGGRELLDVVLASASTSAVNNYRSAEMDFRARAKRSRDEIEKEAEEQKQNNELLRNVFTKLSELTDRFPVPPAVPQASNANAESAAKRPATVQSVAASRGPSEAITPLRQVSTPVNKYTRMLLPSDHEKMSSRASPYIIPSENEKTDILRLCARIKERAVVNNHD